MKGCSDAGLRDGAWNSDDGKVSSHRRACLWGAKRGRDDPKLQVLAQNLNLSHWTEFSNGELLAQPEVSRANHCAS